ncbi:MAG: 7TM diverse intracellular signaling domain-containing protein [Oligoflexus sp.]
MMHILLRILFLLTVWQLFFVGNYSHGQTAPVLVMDERYGSGTHLGSFVEYVQDDRTSEYFEDLRQEWRDLSPQHKNSDHLNLGPAAKPHWFRLLIQVNERQKILMEHDYPSDYLEVFHISPHEDTRSYSLGYEAGYSASLDYRHETLSLNLEPGLHEFYFRLEHKGAMRFSLRLWSAENFALAKSKQELAVGIILGISILMVFYNIFLYMMIRSKVYLHYVGYLCSTSFFLCFYSGLSNQLGNPLKWLANHIWVSSMLLTVFFLLRFTRIFLNLPKRMPKFDRLFRWSSYFLLFGAGLELIDQNWAFFIFHILMFPSVLLCLTVATFSALRGYRPAWFYLIAFFAVICGATVENLVVMEVINSQYSFWVYFSTYSVQMVLLSLAIGDQIHLEQISAHKKIQTLNQDLHHHIEHINDLVEEKTRDIQSIMSHIQQGIYMITEPERRIHKDRSAFLQDIIGQTIEQDTDGVEVLFQNSKVSRDQIEQMKSVVDHTLGSDNFSYFANQHCLVREITKTDVSGDEQFLEVDYYPIYNAEDLCDKLLVCVRDVTNLRALQSRSIEQNETLEMIGEMLQLDGSSFARFYQTNLSLCEDSQRLISSLDSADDETLKILFVNLHTLKGNSRNAHLQRLADMCHHVEDLIFQYRQDHSRFDLQDLSLGLHKIDSALKRYAEINNQILGRKIGEQDGVKLCYKDAEPIIHEIALSRSGTAGRMLQCLDQIDFFLKKLFHNNPESVLKDCFTGIERLASDLGKEEPHIELSVPEIFLTKEAEVMLRHVFVHLIRNSMDHGIEEATRRIELGKDPRGTIAVDVWEEAGELLIRYKDDGKGLDLPAIRARALKEGLLVERFDLSDELIASCIFQSGFTTRKSVSSVSGRGVGMDAVKRYISKNGGTITIRLLEPDTPQHGRPFELLMSLPETTYVKQAA